MNPYRNVFVFTSERGGEFRDTSDVNVVEIGLTAKYNNLAQYEKDNGRVVEAEDTKNLFINVDRYDTMMEFRVMTPTAPSDSIFIKTSDVDGTIDSFKKDSIPPSYDIFTGGSVQLLPQEEQAQVSKYMATLMYRMLTYMSAGYLEKKNTKKIDDWCVCFYDPIMLYFVHYFGVHSQSEDITVVDEFLTNAQFRQMITIELMKVSAHYAVNNNLIDDMSTVKSWISYEYKNWVAIYNKIN